MNPQNTLPPEHTLLSPIDAVSILGVKPQTLAVWQALRPTPRPSRWPDDPLSLVRRARIRLTGYSSPRLSSVQSIANRGVNQLGLEENIMARKQAKEGDVIAYRPRLLHFCQMR